MTSAGFIVRDPLEGFSSFGLNAFTVPAHESFRINGLTIYAPKGRPFLVRGARILRQPEPEMCARIESRTCMKREKSPYVFLRCIV
jgi:hypothetical protein